VLVDCWLTNTGSTASNISVNTIQLIFHVGSHSIDEENIVDVIIPQLSRLSGVPFFVTKYVVDGACDRMVSVVSNNLS